MCVCVCVCACALLLARPGRLSSTRTRSPDLPPGAAGYINSSGGASGRGTRSSDDSFSMGAAVVPPRGRYECGDCSIYLYIRFIYLSIYLIIISCARPCLYYEDSLLRQACRPPWPGVVTDSASLPRLAGWLAGCGVGV
eukprot:GHVU01079801.1.p1 GENE.GHVU01079801.1~~GHVU01079801.1.p1  ORF type:complete len:139 (+),score=9.97 GHVU01079801.1:117-533(+)